MKKLLVVMMVAVMAMAAVACAKKAADEPGEVVGTEAPTKGEGEAQAETIQATEAKTQAETQDAAQAESEVPEIIGMPNPMVETDAKGIMDKLGVEFRVPEGATDVQYFVIGDELAEMKFNLDGVKFTARIKPAAEFTDISGMYYTWENEEPVKIGHCDGKMTRIEAEGADGTIDICLWFDRVPGLMYSLTAEAQDLDGFDITAVAGQVYEPAQGDA